MSADKIFCNLSKAEMTSADAKGQLCHHCFKVFPSDFQRRFHKHHTCWHSPYEKFFCQKKNCFCPRFDCRDEDNEDSKDEFRECYKTFVTQFELDFHKKYNCWRSKNPPNLTKEELESKKFICYKCGKGYATKGLLNNCFCDPEDLFDHSRYVQYCNTVPKECELNPTFYCNLCSATFEKSNQYFEHDCLISSEK